MSTNITLPALHVRFLNCTGTSTDTRTIGANCMFFALKGPNFDANAFAAEALAKGAKYAVVDDASVITDDRYLLVPDVLRALQDLATYHRRTFDIPVIGITGSNGKTTTKELVYAVLSADRPTLATTGNLNNHIGVPLTLLSLPADCEIAIVEMGMNHAGEIALLSQLARPDHAIITSVGQAHMEFFDSVLSIARAKLEITEGMKAGGVLLYHADSPGLSLARETCQRKDIELCPFGLGSGEAVRADFLGAGKQGISLAFENQELKNSHYFSRAMATNLFGTAMLALKSGCLPATDLADAVRAARPLSGGRFAVFQKDGKLLVDDTYNANPTSFSAALEDLRRLLPHGKLAVLAGEMAELGDSAAGAHREVGRRAAELGYSCLAYCGEIHGPLLAAEFRQVAPDAFTMAARNSEELARKVLPLLGEFDGILVKGSRSSRMERVSQVIKDQGYV